MNDTSGGYVLMLFLAFNLGFWTPDCLASRNDSPLAEKCRRVCGNGHYFSYEYSPESHVCACDNGSAFVLGSTARQLLPAHQDDTNR